jgi:hypothetical protein
MRVVLDTGILIAALITADTPPDQVYQVWRKKALPAHHLGMAARGIPPGQPLRQGQEISQAH